MNKAGCATVPQPSGTSFAINWARVLAMSALLVMTTPKRCQHGGGLQQPHAPQAQIFTMVSQEITRGLPS